MVFSSDLGVMLKKYAWNISYMPVLIFIAFLDLDRKASFLDRHQLTGEGWTTTAAAQTQTYYFLRNIPW